MSLFEADKICVALGFDEAEQMLLVLPIE